MFSSCACCACTKIIHKLMDMKETNVPVVKEYILENFLQSFIHEKLPATARSHGRVGFHALGCGEGVDCPRHRSGRAQKVITKFSTKTSRALSFFFAPGLRKAPCLPMFTSQLEVTNFTLLISFALQILLQCLLSNVDSEDS